MPNGFSTTSARGAASWEVPDDAGCDRGDDDDRGLVVTCPHGPREFGPAHPRHLELDDQRFASTAFGALQERLSATA